MRSDYGSLSITRKKTRRHGGACVAARCALVHCIVPPTEVAGKACGEATEQLSDACGTSRGTRTGLLWVANAVWRAALSGEVGACCGKCGDVAMWRRADFQGRSQERRGRALGPLGLLGRRADRGRSRGGSANPESMGMGGSRHPRPQVPWWVLVVSGAVCGGVCVRLALVFVIKLASGSV